MMKNVVKMFSAAALLLGSLSANAAIITQDVKINGNTFFSMGLNFDEMAYADKLANDPFFEPTQVGTAFDPDILSLNSFSFLGEMIAPEDMDYFEVVLNGMDLSQTFSFLSFDFESMATGIVAAFSFDEAFPEFTEVSFSYPNGDIDVFTADDVDFALVPEPSVLSVLALGMGMLLFGRRQRS